MKKILLAITFICAFSLLGNAQNTEKVLKMGKWYANAELGSKAITLTKTMPAKSEFDMELINETAMSIGKIAKADFVNDQGGQTKAGTYYVNGYGYKVTGSTVLITSQPLSWTYNVKSLKNGDLLWEIVTSTSGNKSTN